MPDIEIDSPEDVRYLREIEEISGMMPTHEEFLVMAERSRPPQWWYDEGEEVADAG